MRHVKRFIPLFVIIALMILAYATGLHKQITFENLKVHHATIKAFVAAHPILTPILFICIYFASTALSLPGGALLSIFGGFLFPQPISTIYVVFAATLGATCIFLAAKTALGDYLKRRAGKLLQKMESGFKENAWSYLLFLRFVPLFPFWLVNIAPAFFRVSLFTFLWTTLLGIAPGSFVFTQAGRGLSSIFETQGEFTLEGIFSWHIRVALLALGLFALLPILIKKIRNRNAKT